MINRSECSYCHLGSCPSKSIKNGVAPSVQQTVSHCATGSTRNAAKLVAQTVDNNSVHLFPTQEKRILPCMLALPWLWPRKVIAGVAPPPRPSAHRSRCPEQRVCNVLLSALGTSSLCIFELEQHCPICVRTRTRQWGPKCDVDCQLSTRKHGKSCASTLMRLPSLTKTSTHVPRRHVEHHPGSHFSAKAGQRTFNSVARFFNVHCANIHGDAHRHQVVTGIPGTPIQ